VGLSDIRVVLITGAGASRNLGLDEPMPLMVDWAATLSTALDRTEPGLASACQLSGASDGEAFEQALGDLLTWGRSLQLQARYHALTADTTNKRGAHYRAAVSQAQKRWPTILRVINQTLFAEFGLGRIDGDAAQASIGSLLTALGIEANGEQLFCATTNYDPSLELGLSRLGLVELGFETRAFATPRFAPERFEPWEGVATPVLHLHGAVGWYRDDAGDIIQLPVDQDFDDRRTPVVLYPDPAKNPFDEAGVRQLWSVLRRAVGTATHVVVVGHSLHDRPLLDAIADQLDHKTRLAFCHHDESEIAGMKARVDQVPRLRLRTQRIQFPHCSIDRDTVHDGLTEWFRSLG
jgi:hypothetical protein